MYNTNKINDNYMEYWNMHTIKGKTIGPNKIKLVKINDSINANDVLEYMIKNSNIKIKNKLPFLYGYFKFIEKVKKIRNLKDNFFLNSIKINFTYYKIYDKIL